MIMPFRVVSCSEIRFTTMRSYNGRMFIMLLASNECCGRYCCPVVLDRLVPGVQGNHLPHLITDLLPVVNEVAGLVPAHYFGSLVFEYRDNAFGTGALPVILFTRH